MAERWLAWLEQQDPSGAALLPAGDEGVVVRQRARLEERGYRLPETAGEASLAMLDKSRTYELARAAGVPCPRTWPMRSTSDVVALERKLPFSCALKPVHSHLLATSPGNSRR
jgi:predicted ATP-grasp superfamily ATP-dependent carboligase